jgi:hypothetical protein
MNALPAEDSFAVPLDPCMRAQRSVSGARDAEAELDVVANATE